MPIEAGQQLPTTVANPIFFFASASTAHIDFNLLWKTIPASAGVSARRLLPAQVRDATAFVRDHEAAWTRLHDIILAWQRVAPSSSLHCGSKTFLAGWFCPQVASALSTLLAQRVTLLCTDNPPWLNEFEKGGLCLQIRNADAPLKLQELLKAGKPCAGMLDRVYTQTEAIQVPFGSASLSMPKRILDAIIAAEYELHVPAIAGDTLKDGDRLTTKGKTATSVAQWYAARLHERIVQKPSDWLTLYTL